MNRTTYSCSDSPIADHLPASLSQTFRGCDALIGLGGTCPACIATQSSTLVDLIMGQECCGLCVCQSACPMVDSAVSYILGPDTTARVSTTLIKEGKFAEHASKRTSFLRDKYSTVLSPYERTRRPFGMVAVHLCLISTADSSIFEGRKRGEGSKVFRGKG